MRSHRDDNYEKHRAPVRVPRAGVNGGSAPDSLRVIINSNKDPPTPKGWWVGKGL